MTFVPRHYQTKLDEDTDAAWRDGHRNLLVVSPTGSGKTKFMGMKARKMNGRGVAIAHRKELVGQISTAMAELGVPHNLIAADGTVKNCIQRHMKAIGRSLYDPRAAFTVSSVDTLIARGDDVKIKQWASEVTNWMQDEAHHCLSNNKWGVAAAMFPNARGMGVTATPLRADRKSLHVDQGGLFDHMVLGPTARELIDEGSLCDYRVFVPPASINRDLLDVGATGDFTGSSMRKVAHDSKIVGDIVQHYLRLARGLQAICFVVDVEQAMEVAAAFNNSQVRAAAVSAKTPEMVRDQVIAKFANGQLDVLVNVDLFGEGFDVPAVSVVIMGRPTESYGLYVQQFGRALRPLPGKTHGLIIDHVGNFQRHGMPDAPRRWTLFAEEKGRKKEKDPDVIPVTRCVNADCWKGYAAYLKACPYCGHQPEPVGRSRPEQVQGDLVELDPKILDEMRKRAAEAMVLSSITVVDPRTTVMARHWNERVEAQRVLRDVIATWAWKYHSRGKSDSEIHRIFWHRFKTDVLTAQALGRAESETLTKEIENAQDW